jgi:hypothetical protein
MAFDPAVEFNKMRKQTYAMSHSWVIEIPFATVKTIIKDHPDWGERWDSASAKNGSVVDDNINLRCKSSTIPKSTVKTEKVKIYGMSTNVVLEDDTEGSITLTFLEDGSHGLYRFFSAWKDFGASHRTYAMYDRKDISVQEGVKLKLLRPDVKTDDKTNIKDYTMLAFNLYGVQPVKVDLSNLDNNINFMTLTVTLKFDCFEVE